MFQARRNSSLKIKITGNWVIKWYDRQAGIKWCLMNRLIEPLSVLSCLIIGFEYFKRTLVPQFFISLNFQLCKKYYDEGIRIVCGFADGSLCQLNGFGAAESHADWHCTGMQNYWERGWWRYGKAGWEKAPDNERGKMPLRLHYGANGCCKLSPSSHWARDLVSLFQLQDGNLSIEGFLEFASVATGGDAAKMKIATELANECGKLTDADRCELAFKAGACISLGGAKRNVDFGF